jgi:sugar phosphate isomerase/epimerase
MPNLAPQRPVSSRRIRQSVVPWCFQPLTAEQLIVQAVGLGLESVELVSPDLWPLLAQHDLDCALVPSTGFAVGFCRPEDHESCLQILRQTIPAAANAGYRRVITFTGMQGQQSAFEARRQEINYEGVMQALLEIGYDGYVGHEFMPRGNDPLAALRQAIEICDV